MQPANSALISDEYQKEQQRLHETENYGTASILYAQIVSSLINRLQVSHVLDYGCGANTNLAKNLKVDHKLKYQAYDPGVPRFNREPIPAEMVCCIDVLEHIEPDKLDSVLDHLVQLTEGIIFASIDTGAAKRVLSDGRNAHLIQQPMQWWLPKLWERFDLQSYEVAHEKGFFVVGMAKVRLESKDGKLL